MSEIKVNNIQSSSGTNGPVVSGITTMASSGAMSLPRGDTAYRGGRGRGLFGGGRDGGGLLNNIDYIINLQGDEPLIDINDIINLNNLAINNNFEIATLACRLKTQNATNENVVKVICNNNIENNKFSSAKNFLRIIESENLENVYHHIGIYIYKVSVLEKFVSLKQTPNEIKLKLEQLRALENNIKIDVVFTNSIPVGVDTKEDYLEIKKLMEYKS